METGVVSNAAILMEDIKLALDRIRGRETANDSIPVDVFVDAVERSLERLKNQNDVDICGWDEKVHETRYSADEDLEEVLVALYNDVRNDSLEVDA
jgi:hypothetical protein